jgi:hypothetical protein
MVGWREKAASEWNFSRMPDIRNTFLSVHLIVLGRKLPQTVYCLIISIRRHRISDTEIAGSHKATPRAPSQSQLNVPSWVTLDARARHFRPPTRPASRESAHEQRCPQRLPNSHNRWCPLLAGSCELDSGQMDADPHRAITNRVTVTGTLNSFPFFPDGGNWLTVLPDLSAKGGFGASNRSTLLTGPSPQQGEKRRFFYGRRSSSAGSGLTVMHQW